MSVVLAYADSKTAIISGDSRVINTLNNEIITESFKKVRKVNNRVIVGFSGDALPCAHIFDSIVSDENVSNYYAEDVIQELKSKSSVYPIRQEIRFTICGIGKNEEICAAIMVAHKETQVYYPNKSGPFFCEFTPKEFLGDSNFYKNTLQSKPPLEAMKEIIEYCSQISPSVNNVVAYECIELE